MRPFHAHEAQPQNPFGHSFMVPAPHAFPRDATASALEDHARLTDRFLETILFRLQSRELLAIPGAGEVMVGVTGRQRDGHVVEALMMRAEAVKRTSSFHRLRAELFVTPDEPDTLPLLVQASGAVSWQTIEVHRRAPDFVQVVS